MATASHQQLLTTPPRGRMRAVIAGCDPSERNLLRHAVLSNGGYELVGEAAAGNECTRLIARELPELVICSGTLPCVVDRDAVLPVLITVGGPTSALPRVVCDIAMPLREEQLAQALAAAASRIVQIKVSDLSRLIQTYVSHGHDCDPPPTHIRVDDKNGGEPIAISIADILWIKAAGNYVHLYTAAGRFEVRNSISNMASKLERSGFVRIHRGAVVNAGAIRQQNRTDGMLTSVALCDGTLLLVGPNYRHQLSEPGGTSTLSSPNTEEGIPCPEKQKPS